MENGYWEVKDANGIWHKITGFQAASYRADGVQVRYIENK